MRIDVLTLFPGMFLGPLQESLLQKAQENGILDIRVSDIREFTLDKHRSVDDYPFGGGAGMVMQAEPIFRAVDQMQTEAVPDRVILMCPQGVPLTQGKALELAEFKHLVIICGHYEGIDERVREHLVTEEISLGDFVLTGGELPAMVLIDAVCRLIPGVIGSRESIKEESFNDGLLEYPQYTRPRLFRDYAVPEILLSGDHEKIRRWRRQQALIRTWQRRPDLFLKHPPSDEDILLLKEAGIQLVLNGVMNPPDS
ncbi:MAG: tRNA (guanosine(37)-N1)-methyltransferase TrmD [Bacillota bacterium]